MSELVYFNNVDDSRTVTITDSDSVAIDITGYTFWFMVKANFNDPDDDAVIDKTITSLSDPTNGQFVLALTNSDLNLTAANLNYTLKWKDDSNDVKIIGQGEFKIEQGGIVKTS